MLAAPQGVTVNVTILQRLARLQTGIFCFLARCWHREDVEIANGILCPLNFRLGLSSRGSETPHRFPVSSVRRRDWVQSWLPIHGAGDRGLFLAAVRAAVFHARVIRILSDLHFYDAYVEVSEFRQLEPLLEGVHTLILNGDSCEMRRGLTREQVDALKGFFAARVPEVIFITGNHDPDISETHELLAARDRVWITHGDVFFENFTPWSRHARQFRSRIAGKVSALAPGEFDQLPIRLRIAREVAREETEVLDLTERGFATRVIRLCRNFFPPTQVWQMLRAWRELPDRVAGLARAQRPTAQVVITGHVHFPRVWRRGELTVINTGSFFRPLGGHLVDIEGERVTVRRIRRIARDFHPGSALAEIPLRA